MAEGDGSTWRLKGVSSQKRALITTKKKKKRKREEGKKKNIKTEKNKDIKEKKGEHPTLLV